MLVLYGSNPFSSFRTARLRQRLQLADPRVCGLHCAVLYFAACPAGTLPHGDRMRLQKLLKATPSPPRILNTATHAAAREHHSWVVAPRLGTISPWSSKATDIARNCGLQQAGRLERGLLFVLERERGGGRGRRAAALLYDPMTETLLQQLPRARQLFRHADPQRGASASLGDNAAPGFAKLDAAEQAYVVDFFRTLRRPPSDTELEMFLQATSEHCRHKVFNAIWEGGAQKPHSLFDLIRATCPPGQRGVLIAYKDNGAVLEGGATRHLATARDGVYRESAAVLHTVLKAETHNHPTAVSPLPGAATGVGGELRDIAATGRGATPVAGFTGFSVSQLNIPDFPQPWEHPATRPKHFASPLDIMLEAPIGGAAFNNEFGRPALCGYFRSFAQAVPAEERQLRAYHKPIMLAGGIGHIRAALVAKQKVPPGALIVVLGGPALRIGLGGGAASSRRAGEEDAQRDFASVQRHNPEMQRRCQSVIDACCALGEQSPILFCHDVGAGGLANAIPELLHDNDLGGQVELRDIPSHESDMTPLESWCNEAQERYVLALAPPQLERFRTLCARERCPFAVVGESRRGTQLVVHDAAFAEKAVDVPLRLLFGDLPLRRFTLPQDSHASAPAPAAATKPAPTAAHTSRAATPATTTEPDPTNPAPTNPAPTATQTSRAAAPATTTEPDPTNPAPTDPAPTATQASRTAPATATDPAPTAALISRTAATAVAIDPAPTDPAPIATQTSRTAAPATPAMPSMPLGESLRRVLRLPSVAGKGFLITIGDRSVGGLSHRDQMVGPWQTPVADAALSLEDYRGFRGTAIALGERAPLSLIDAAAAARMACGEAFTNLCGSGVATCREVKLCANWMADLEHPGEDLLLYRAVRALSELCRQLGCPIPVGKDSLFMHAQWGAPGHPHSAGAPLSLVVSACAPVADVRRAVTPQLLSGARLAEHCGTQREHEDTVLLLIDLGRGRNRLGGSALSQVWEKPLGAAPDLDDAALLHGLLPAIATALEKRWLLALHDRSDGGLLVNLCEMAWAGQSGLELQLDALPGDPLELLFNEELGLVAQLRRQHLGAFREVLRQHGLDDCCRLLGSVNSGTELRLSRRGKSLLRAKLPTLHRLWAETSYRMQALRDHDRCAHQEWRALSRRPDAGLHIHWRCRQPAAHEDGQNAQPAAAHEDNKDAQPTRTAPAPGQRKHRGRPPRAAILREQGVHGHREMAAAFQRAGFASVDVHMSDLLAGRTSLEDFRVLAACGGFSYGDVLGAGRGWAQTILCHDQLREQFRDFFHRDDTLSLGVCNGCQMLSQLRTLIPGAEHWPNFLPNRSEQYEARLVMVEILDSPCLFTGPLAGSRLPIVVSHGEGRLHPTRHTSAQQLLASGSSCLRYVDNQGHPTQRYPANPNGSPLGLTGLTTRDGRATIMMPHPERLFRSVQYSFLPPSWKKEEGPWMQIFHNAKQWLDSG